MGAVHVQSEGAPSSSRTSSKRKRAPTTTAPIRRQPHEDEDPELVEVKPLKKRVKKSNAEDEEDGFDEIAAHKKKGKKKAKPDEEKRLRRYRDKPPQSYKEIEERALTQRMFVIERTRSGTEGLPEETIELAGSTGNVYTITICKVPKCNCPHAEKGNQCKHIIYVMNRVLRAPTNLQYQLALLSDELREILSKAPPILSADNTAKDGHRKEMTDDCPICCTEFEPESEEIVWCKAACGNNVHKTCFEQWAATKQGAADGVTCPFCRTPWMEDEDVVKKIVKSGKKNAEGYVNVAEELGISTQRDNSTYHSFRVRR